jgi:pyruvate kinase
VAAEAESYDQDRASPLPGPGVLQGVAGVVADAVGAIAGQTGATAVAVWTVKGTLARMLSKQRLDRPVLAFTGQEAIRRRMTLYYGIQSVRADMPESVDERMAIVGRTLTSAGLASPGDTVVVGFGPHTLTCGDTGSIVIHVIPDDVRE